MKFSHGISEEDLIESFIDNLDIPEDYTVHQDEIHWLYKQHECMALHNNFIPWSY